MPAHPRVITACCETAHAGWRALSRSLVDVVSYCLLLPALIITKICPQRRGGRRPDHTPSDRAVPCCIQRDTGTREGAVSTAGRPSKRSTQWHAWQYQPPGPTARGITCSMQPAGVAADRGALSAEGAGRGADIVKWENGARVGGPARTTHHGIPCPACAAGARPAPAQNLYGAPGKSPRECFGTPAVSVAERTPAVAKSACESPRPEASCSVHLFKLPPSCPSDRRATRLWARPLCTSVTLSAL